MAYQPNEQGKDDIDQVGFSLICFSALYSTQALLSLF
jgi:hypothetical protein